jgi:molecular chaperone HtpG
VETLTLTAETGRLLDLVVHSLYTRPDVFLRELISNASDALDRRHFETLFHPQWAAAEKPEIRLEPDAAARTLTVRDNGIGMSREELVAHIGTIARSGTVEFQRQLSDEQRRGQALDLIGRFGVGFYACFMVADRITLVTRRVGTDRGTRWESTGDVTYTIDDAEDVPDGTAVTLHLKAVDEQGGRDDYTDGHVLAAIVKRYADFVSHPILLVDAAVHTGEGNAADGARSTRTVLNAMTPIWNRPEASVTAVEYDAFYSHLTHDVSPPLLRVAARAEGRWEYAALLFVPAHAPYDLHYHAMSYGLRLYSTRMLIVENCSELLPRYLRFVRGVVDTAALPLNVSRQSLQDAHHLGVIRRWVTRKILDALQTLHECDPGRYATLWHEFGRALKEGVSEDPENQDRLLPLLRFESSAHASSLTTLEEYASRMPAEQKDIFYVTGESRAVAERAPHIEAIRARGFEVLYFTEPVDELLAQAVPEFKGRRLRAAGKGQIELDELHAGEPTDEETERLKGLLSTLAAHLGSEVRDVRLSRRLTTSPGCLAGEEFDFSPHIERLLGDNSALRRRRTLELNAAHPIVHALQQRFAADPGDPMLAVGADLLFGMALLAEGSPIADPVRFTDRLIDVFGTALAAPETHRHTTEGDDSHESIR